MTALGELAAAVNDGRRRPGPGRLILRCGPAVCQALTAAGAGVSLVPAIPTREGQGLTYRQTEVEVDGGRDTGWTLIDDGTIVAEGEL